ncbi:MAG: nickel insertion protein [Candidatus Binatia bacterium]
MLYRWRIMRALYFDAVAGVSGDMTVGALLALGVEIEHLRAQLATLPLRGYAVRASRGWCMPSRRRSSTSTSRTRTARTTATTTRTGRSPRSAS